MIGKEKRKWKRTSIEKQKFKRRSRRKGGERKSRMYKIREEEKEEGKVGSRLKRGKVNKS